jgi:hypothetical protein
MPNEKRERNAKIVELAKRGSQKNMRAKKRKLTPDEEVTMQLLQDALKAVNDLSTHFQSKLDSRMFLANQAWWKLYEIDVP